MYKQNIAFTFQIHLKLRSYLNKMPQFILETVIHTATGCKEQNKTEEIKIHTYKYKK